MENIVNIIIQNIIKKIIKNKIFLEKIFNNCSKEAFEYFKEYTTNILDEDEYDFYDIDDFFKYNHIYPKVYYEWNSKYIDARFKVYGTSKDTEMLYQRYVMKYIKKYDKELKAKNISLKNDDQEGIFIVIK